MFPYFMLVHTVGLFERLQSFFLSPGYDVIAVDHLHPLGACSLTLCANIKHILVETLATGPLIVWDPRSGCNQHLLLQPFALYFFLKQMYFLQFVCYPYHVPKMNFIRHVARSTISKLVRVPLRKKTERLFPSASNLAIKPWDLFLNFNSSRWLRCVRGGH